MSDPSNDPSFNLKTSASEPFYQTWIKAVTKPNEQTYAEIADSPDSKPNTAYIWMFAVTAISAFLSAVVTTLVIAMNTGDSSALGSGLVTILCAVPIGGAIGTAFFALGTAIIQWIAKLFGGTGSYEKLVYVAAAFGAPMGLISGVLSGLSQIPSIGLCFSVLLIGFSLYSLYLEILAVKVVNNLDWGKAAASVLVPGLVVGFVCACLIIGLFAAIAPALNDAFNSIYGQ